MMFSMNYDFEVKSFRKQGVQFTFMKKPGYIFIFVGLAISFLCQFLLEKNDISIGISAVTVSLFMVIHVRSYQKESLLILSGIGVTVKKSGLWGTDSRYFDLQHIQDIVIIEAISMQSVYFQLVLIPQETLGDADQERKLYPLFKDFQPSLHHLKTVYRHAQEKLIIPREKLNTR